MKILTKEEEQEHYHETLKGGFIGGGMGIAIAGLGVYAGALRYPVIRHLTLPMRAFLVTSGGTFAAIINADHYSRAYERRRNPVDQYKDENERVREQLAERETTGQKVKDLFRERRYQLVGGSWVASIGTAFALVGRNPYLTTQQKIVQARVYAQGFTLLVMAGLAAFEISDKNKGQGRWETIRVIDPEDPEHKRVIEKQIHHEEYEGEDLWRGVGYGLTVKKDMIETEERKMKERKKLAEETQTPGQKQTGAGGKKDSSSSSSQKKKKEAEGGNGKEAKKGKEAEHSDEKESKRKDKGSKNENET